MSELLEQRIEAALHEIQDVVDAHGALQAAEAADVLRRALLASDAVLAQAGMVVVPVKMTPAMFDACLMATVEKGVRAGYAAALDAFANPVDGG